MHIPTCDTVHAVFYGCGNSGLLSPHWGGLGLLLCCCAAAPCWPHLQVKQAVKHHEVAAQCCLVLLLSLFQVTVKQLQTGTTTGRTVCGRAQHRQLHLCLYVLAARLKATNASTQWQQHCTSTTIFVACTIQDVPNASRRTTRSRAGVDCVCNAKTGLTEHWHQQPGRQPHYIYHSKLPCFC